MVGQFLHISQAQHKPPHTTLGTTLHTYIMPGVSAVAPAAQAELAELIAVLSKAGKKAPPAPRVEALEKFSAIIAKVREVHAPHYPQPSPPPSPTLGPNSLHLPSPAQPSQARVRLHLAGVCACAVGDC